MQAGGRLLLFVAENCTLTGTSVKWNTHTTCNTHSCKWKYDDRIHRETSCRCLAQRWFTAAAVYSSRGRKLSRSTSPPPQLSLLAVRITWRCGRWTGNRKIYLEWPYICSSPDPFHRSDSGNYDVTLPRPFSPVTLSTPPLNQLILPSRMLQSITWSNSFTHRSLLLARSPQNRSGFFRLSTYRAT